MFENTVSSTWAEINLDNIKFNLKSNVTIKSISSTQNSLEVLNDKE